PYRIHPSLSHHTCFLSFYFFFNPPATTEFSTLSLHDALPICLPGRGRGKYEIRRLGAWRAPARDLLLTSGSSPVSQLALSSRLRDRKSTRLNSSHVSISYAVFCLKKKKKKIMPHRPHIMQHII